MATGLKIPVGVGKSGGAALETSSSKQNKKILLLALSEGGDNNSFQRLGIGNLIFKIKDVATRAQVQREIQKVIGQLSDRIALIPNEPITFREDIEGELEVSIKYIDIETNKVEEFTPKFTR